jgi:hypothetical protein
MPAQVLLTAGPKSTLCVALRHEIPRQLTWSRYSKACGLDKAHPVPSPRYPISDVPPSRGVRSIVTMHPGSTKSPALNPRVKGQPGISPDGLYTVACGPDPQIARKGRNFGVGLEAVTLNTTKYRAMSNFSMGGKPSKPFNIFTQSKPSQFVTPLGSNFISQHVRISPLPCNMLVPAVGGVKLHPNFWEKLNIHSIVPRGTSSANFTPVPPFAFLVLDRKSGTEF